MRIARIPVSEAHSPHHRIRDTGTPLGPELSEIGKQNTPVQLLKAMLDPSKRIDPKYLA